MHPDCRPLCVQVYPVGSPNLKDFYHLVDVYLDATLRPRLEAQEGWHLEAEEGGRLS